MGGVPKELGVEGFHTSEGWLEKWGKWKAIDEQYIFVNSIRFYSNL